MSAERVEPLAIQTNSRDGGKEECGEQPAAEKKSGRRRKWGWHDWVYLTILALLVVVAARLFTPDFGGETPGTWWDPLLNTWTLTWDTNTMLHAPGQLWQAPLLYPNHLSLTYSENLLGEAVLFAPFYLLSHNPVLAYNATFYLTLFLCSVNMYVAARFYIGKPFAAFVAALAYTYSPYRLSQIDHIHVLAGEWIPLAFMCLDLALQRGKWRHWMLFALFYLLQILSSIYYGIFLIYTLLAYVLIRYGKTFLRQARAERGAYIKRLLREAVKPLVALGAAGVVLLVLMEPYLASLRNGYARTVLQSGEYSAFIRDFYYAIPFNKLHGVAVSHGETLPLDGEHFLFLGLTTMALVVIGLALAWKRDKVLRAFALTGLIVLLFAFGPFLQYSTGSGAPLLPTQPYNYPFLPRIPMPWLLAYYVLPGFQGLRVPARLVGVLLMTLALLAAYTVAWLQAYWEKHTNRQEMQGTAAAIIPSRMRFAQVVAAGCVLVILPLALLGEALPAYVPVTHVPTGANIPAVYKWLGSHGGSTPIVELPMSHADETFKVKQEAWYDYYAIYHSHPIVDGWSGYRPQTTIEISQALLSFPLGDSLPVLQRIHVKYVVFHPQLYLGFDCPGLLAAIVAQMQSSAHLQLVEVFGESVATSDSVWQVI